MPTDELATSTATDVPVDARPAARRSRQFRIGILAAPAIVFASLLGSGPLPAISHSVEGAADFIQDMWTGGDVGPTPSPSPSSPGRAVGSPTTAPTAGSGASPRPNPTEEGDGYLLMSRANLLALPTSGPAWDALLAVANGDPGRADLRDQDERHGVRTLAIAIVFARTGEPGYRERARGEILDVIGTEEEGAENSILSLGRQLAAYVLAADFIGLDGADDDRFRGWLASIRTQELGGHGRWRSLVATHQDSANNWGAFAGASRMAASRYLGDTADVEAAAKVLAGFLGDRTAWDDFQPVDDSAEWACDPDGYTPINPPCLRDGVDLDGAIVRDIDRGGGLRWPPGDAGISYTLESLQGLVLQAELLYQGGYGDPWSWSDEAIRRAARIVSDSGRAGGETWNRSEPSYHVTWLLNERYDLALPTEPAGFGRAFGYTDWLYGG